jgi:hypothetical protein
MIKFETIYNVGRADTLATRSQNWKNVAAGEMFTLCRTDIPGIHGTAR